MTEIKWYWEDGCCGVTAEGHAAYNPGNDIVCAAISALLQTMYAGLQIQCYAPTIKTEGDGRYALHVLIAKWCEKEVSALFNSVILGLQMIAGEYPDNVKIERVHRECKGEGETFSNIL